MYGWDSYFIIRGLLRENRIGLAKGMVENFFFEIENYGGVLNANRTYYLTRSQPPFLSSMVLAVYEAQAQQGNRISNGSGGPMGWWSGITNNGIRSRTSAGETGLSRYFDQGEGPVPEIMGDPSHYYRGVANYFLIHEGIESPHLIFPDERNTFSEYRWADFPAFVCDPGPIDCEAARLRAPGPPGIDRRFL